MIFFGSVVGLFTATKCFVTGVRDSDDWKSSAIAGIPAGLALGLRGIFFSFLFSFSFLIFFLFLSFIYFLFIYFKKTILNNNGKVVEGHKEQCGVQQVLVLVQHS